MIDSNAGNAGKAQLLGRLNARHAVDDEIVAPNQHGIAKAQRGDRSGNLTNMGSL
jgi:hypothetical protein